MVTFLTKISYAVTKLFFFESFFKNISSRYFFAKTRKCKYCYFHFVYWLLLFFKSLFYFFSCYNVNVNRRAFAHVRCKRIKLKILQRFSRFHTVAFYKYVDHLPSVVYNAFNAVNAVGCNADYSGIESVGKKRFRCVVHRSPFSQYNKPKPSSKIMASVNSVIMSICLVG